jgi:hypothetical protein
MTPRVLKTIENRREETRHNIYTLLPVNIIDEKSRAAVSCRVEDVSQDGLGVLTEGPLKIGHKLLLVTLRERFQLEVAWCEKVEGRKEFRVGLRGVDPGKDLSKVFAGFFKEFQAS